MTPELNIPLKTAIFKSGLKQTQIVEKMHKSNAWLSKVIHGGVCKITQPQRERLAEILEVDGKDIFLDFTQDGN